jgi:DNA adenine methylase
MNSVINYFGGKNGGFGNLIFKEFPEHETYKNYIEAFGGSGALLFKKKPHDLEIYNDLEENVYSLFRVLNDEEMFSVFKRKCELSYHSEQIMNEFKVKLREDDIELVERAYMFFYVNRVAFNGVGGYSASATIRRKMSKSVSDFLSVIDRLEDIHQRISSVLLHNRDGIKLVEKWDKPETFMYLDPPYDWSTRTGARYKVDMNDEEQIKLIEVLSNIKHAKILLSGYNCDLYNNLLNLGWTRKDYNVKTQDTKQEGKVKIESLWKNY